MRYLLIFLFLFGCTYETNTIEVEDMDRAWATPEQWGRETVFPADSWRPHQTRVVLTRDTPKQFQAPQTSTLICGVFNPDSDQNQLYQLRWVLRMGTGGARVEVRFDANRFTRITAPIEAFSLGIELDPENEGNPDQPEGPVTAFAFVGEGGIGSDIAQGAVFSQRFALTSAAPEVQAFEIPTGSSAYRIVGINPGVGSPFKTTVTATLVRGATVIQSLVGLGAAPADPSLFTLYASGLYLPIVASPTAIEIADGAGATSGFIQHKIDL